MKVPARRVYLSGLLGSKGIPHELSMWGYEWPHDWPTWRAMLNISSANAYSNCSDDSSRPFLSS